MPSATQNHNFASSSGLNLRKGSPALLVLWTYLLTPWCRVLLEKLTGLQLVKNFLAFYGTRRFITAFTSFRHPSLSWASPIQSPYPQPTSFILILSTHLRLGLPSGLFPSGFHTRTLYAPLSSPIRATCPAHLILLDFITRTILGEEYRPFFLTTHNTQNRQTSMSPVGFELTISAGERPQTYDIDRAATETSGDFKLR